MADYVPFWCEENAWRFLARGAGGHGGALSYALFILPRKGSVAVFSQKAGRAGDGLVLWDYHVVVLLGAQADGAGGTGWKAYDFDSSLPAGISADFWLEASFGRLASFGAEGEVHAPLFRPVDGAEFAGRFFSDRSHMRNSDGSWMKPPPPWQAPCAEDSRPEERWTLADLRDSGKTKGGELFDLEGMRERLRHPGRQSSAFS